MIKKRKHRALTMSNIRWIAGYEGLYLINTNGAIYSFVSNRLLRYGYLRGGYSFVILVKNKEKKIFRVNRLVASTFLGNNLKTKLVVNHKDENPRNNKVENLEWITQKENCNYGSRNKKLSVALMNRKDCSRSVLQFTKDGDFIKRYVSIKEAGRQTGINRADINSCALKKVYRKTAGGFVWVYET